MLRVASDRLYKGRAGRPNLFPKKTANVGTRLAESRAFFNAVIRGGCPGATPCRKDAVAERT